MSLHKRNKVVKKMFLNIQFAKNVIIPAMNEIDNAVSAFHGSYSVQKKPMTAIQMHLEAVRLLAEQEEKTEALRIEQEAQRTEQLRLSTSIQAQADDIAELKETLANHRDESSWQSISTYWKMAGDYVDAKQASSLGRKASSLSRDKGLRVVPIREYGERAHNIYHPDILAIVYGKWKIEQNRKKLNPKMNSFNFSS